MFLDIIVYQHTIHNKCSKHSPAESMYAWTLSHDFDCPEATARGLTDIKKKRW